MFAQSLMCRCIPCIPRRPLPGHIFRQPSRITSIAQVEHQVGAQAIQQALAVTQARLHLRFEQGGDKGQQLLTQGLFIGAVQQRTTDVALI